MRLLKPVIILLIFVFCLGALATCGIEEYFYLEQIPDGMPSAINVSITLPAISGDFYYAEYFTIYYKIYLSNHLDSATINTTSQMSSINSLLNSDYTYFFNNFIDDTKTNVPTTNDFSNRQFYELQFETPELLKIYPGVTPQQLLSINFVARAPAVIQINGADRGRILRNDKLELSPDRFFLSTDDLRSNINAGAVNTSQKQYNWDIYPESHSAQGTSQYAYVSMFIVIQGTNPTNFNKIFSKVTFLGAFMLQDP